LSYEGQKRIMFFYQFNKLKYTKKMIQIN